MRKSERGAQRGRVGGLLPLMALLVLSAGCASLPRHVEKVRSEALPNPDITTLGRIIATEERAHKHLSGIRLLSSGEEALADLIALADHAERTLDIQYYIIHQDDSARTLLQHVRSAADRGVRVRVLVDDLNTAGEDRRFLHLGQHVNVEVRVFNPFPGGRSTTWTRILASVSDIPRINHRMHNKLFVADNALAITGGRNIGDEYFTRDKRSNFIDLDVVAAGPIVPQLSASFDAFWNSKYAYPIASLASPEEAERPAAAAAAPPATAAPLNDGSPGDPEWLKHELDAHTLKMNWVPAMVTFEPFSVAVAWPSPATVSCMARSSGTGERRALKLAEVCASAASDNIPTARHALICICII